MKLKFKLKYKNKEKSCDIKIKYNVKRKRKSIAKNNHILGEINAKVSILRRKRKK